MTTVRAKQSKRRLVEVNMRRPDGLLVGHALVPEGSPFLLSTTTGLYYDHKEGVEYVERRGRRGASHMTNDELDAKVLAAITKDAGLVLRGVEQRVGGGATSRQVDRSLQRLRKSGRITYGGPGTTFTGWRVVTNETRPPYAQDRRRIP